jgi:hypothetical protein
MSPLTPEMEPQNPDAAKETGSKLPEDNKVHETIHALREGNKNQLLKGILDTPPEAPFKETERKAA